MADQIEINIYMRDGTGADINAVDDTTGGGTNLPDVSNSGNTAAAGTKNSAVDLKKLVDGNIFLVRIQVCFKSNNRSFYSKYKKCY